MTPLLEALVDDAGLFPPTQLPMAQALSRHRKSVSPVLSGRFLCPASRLSELASLLEPQERIAVHLLHDVDDPPRTAPGVDVRAVEESDLPRYRPALACYVEAWPSPDLLAAGCFAKLRCGGEAVPATGTVSAFLRAAVEYDVPFKATAGLHAAVRGSDVAPDGTAHHGFLNLALAVCAALSGAAPEPVLECEDPGVLARQVRATPEALARAARAIFHSYGSCDTERPVVDLLELELL